MVVATLNKRTGGKEMNRKFLEQLGLTEEQVEAVMSEHGKSTQDIQAKVSAAEDNAKGLQDQLKERDKDMKQLKQDAEGNADLQQKYSDLDSKYKAQQKEHEQQLKTMQLDHAIEMHLSGQVHDAGIVSSLLDKSKLGLGDNGAVTGLDEQLTALKESKGFLFAPEKAVEPHIAGAKPQGTTQEETVANDLTTQMINAFTSDL